MITREHIENLLRLNGAKATDSDSQIKSILLSAQWREDDVETAIVVLRENNKSHKTDVSSLHKIFRTDGHLPPEDISSLLGIEMNFTSKDIEVKRSNSINQMSLAQTILIFGFAIVLSVMLIYVTMWYLQVGIFHITVS